MRIGPWTIDRRWRSLTLFGLGIASSSVALCGIALSVAANLFIRLLGLAMVIAVPAMWIWGAIQWVQHTHASSEFPIINNRLPRAGTPPPEALVRSSTADPDPIAPAESAELLPLPECLPSTPTGEGG
jgi:hypothetical protein